MWIPPLVVALPLIAAAALAVCGDRVPRRLADAVAILIAATVTALSVVLVWKTAGMDVVHWFGGWRPRGAVVVGIAFAVDPIGAGLAALSGLLMTIALVFTLRYFGDAGAVFHALMLIFLAGLVGFALTGDLFNLFVFFELMSVSAFALCGYKIEDDAALIGGFNFGVTNTVGAILIVLGLALTYARTGALNFAQIADALAGGREDALVTVAFFLLACGFLVKAAVVPFHFWLADAHAVAPTPVCVLFSGVMVEAGLYAVARLSWTAFGTTVTLHGRDLRPLFVSAGAATAVIGSMLCFAQRHLKRMLAFSTIAHVGLMLVAVGLFDPRALAGAAVYVVGHGFAKAALFLTVGIILHRLRTVDELRLAGRGRRLPWIAALLVAGALALAGAPLFATFAGEDAVHTAAEALGWSWTSWVFTFASVATGAAVLRAAGRIFAGLGARSDDVGDVGGRQDEPPETEPRNHTPATMWGMALLSLIGALVTGIYPRFMAGAVSAATRFASPGSYVAQVLGGASAPVPPQIVSRGALTTEAVLRGCATAAAAFALAALALFRQRLPRGLRRAASAVGSPALRVLRLVHGGHAGEYVAWVVVGVTVWGAAALWMTRAAR